MIQDWQSPVLHSNPKFGAFPDQGGRVQTTDEAPPRIHKPKKMRQRV